MMFNRRLWTLRLHRFFDVNIEKMLVRAITPILFIGGYFFVEVSIYHQPDRDLTDAEIFFICLAGLNQFLGPPATIWLNFWSKGLLERMDKAAFAPLTAFFEKHAAKFRWLAAGVDDGMVNTAVAPNGLTLYVSTLDGRVCLRLRHPQLAYDDLTVLMHNGEVTKLISPYTLLGHPNKTAAQLAEDDAKTSALLADFDAAHFTFMYPESYTHAPQMEPAETAPVADTAVQAVALPAPAAVVAAGAVTAVPAGMAALCHWARALQKPGQAAWFTDLLVHIEAAAEDLALLLPVLPEAPDGLLDHVAPRLIALLQAAAPLAGAARDDAQDLRPALEALLAHLETCQDSARRAIGRKALGDAENLLAVTALVPDKMLLPAS